MSEDKVMETMNILSTQNNCVNEYLGYEPSTDKSRRYSWPSGYWTLEVFYNGQTLIPEERVDCVSEPNLDEHVQTLDVLGRGGKFYDMRKPTWRPVTVTYFVFGDNVGSMLVEDHEELQMVHHAVAELTYWLGVDNPDRTWVLKDWMVTNMQMTASKNAISVDLTFIYSEAILTRH